MWRSWGALPQVLLPAGDTATMTGTISRPRSRFGEFARERREELGISVQELAQAAGISASHLSKIERNLISPSYLVVATVCKSLDLDILKLNAKVKCSREIDDQLIDGLCELNIAPEIIEELLTLSMPARKTLAEHLRH
jgi:transcriptional regulator with XRE-family HTH domain